MGITVSPSYQICEMTKWNWLLLWNLNKTLQILIGNPKKIFAVYITYAHVKHEDISV